MYINAFAFALRQKGGTRSRCPGCNKATQFTRSVPKLSGLAELQIFKCVDCGTVVTEAVEAQDLELAAHERLGTHALTAMPQK